MIGTKIEKTITFEKYQDNLKNLLRVLNAKSDTLKLGGGEEAIKKHHGRGKTHRARA